VIGGPNDGFKRFAAGLCPLYPCPGRMMMRDAETKSGPCPEWINKRRMEAGFDAVGPIEVTTYTYKCLECGQESSSTELIQSAVMN
jgi:hypothetical protein